jgi:hypothetical protein
MSKRLDNGDAEILYVLNGGDQVLIQGDGLQVGGHYVNDMPTLPYRLAEFDVRAVSGKAAIAGVKTIAPIKPQDVVGWWVKKDG